MSDYSYNIATTLVAIERQLTILTLDPSFRDDQRKLYSYVDQLLKLNGMINEYEHYVKGAEDDEKLGNELKQSLLQLKLIYGETVMKTDALLKNWKNCLVIPDDIRSIKELAHYNSIWKEK